MFSDNWVIADPEIKIARAFRSCFLARGCASAAAMKKSFSALLLPLVLFTFSSANGAEGYCLAVRGNGELAPAHWGAMARVVEQLGLPAAAAGGSSASVSLFLLESIAMNPAVKAAATADAKADVASFLLKSLQGQLEEIADRQEWKQMRELMVFLRQPDGGSSGDLLTWLKEMALTRPEQLAAFIAKNKTAIEGSLAAAAYTGVINLATLQPLQQAMQEASTAPDEATRLAAMKRAQFLSYQIYQAAALLGKFNAEGDANLFFRPGVVDFAGLAAKLGRIGSFYAGRELGAVRTAQLKKVLSTCMPLARGKTWGELSQLHPSCSTDFKTLLAGYHSAGLPKLADSRELDRVGAYLPTFPTTSVLRGSAYAAAKAALALYPQALDTEFGKNFAVNGDEVRFGYWGPQQALDRIAQNLKTPFRDRAGRQWDFSGDAKSRRFVALGEASWAEALRLSPAEPGLAPLQLFTAASGENMASAGGWSDLHPGAVLKAAGCTNTVYVTRRGGESLFGQSVAKRLIGFSDVPWGRLATDPTRRAASRLRNNQGDAADQKSTWSQLYNLANPASSFNTALKSFDAVVCTDWDRFDVTDSGALEQMIGEAYRAPWALPNAAAPLARAVAAKVKTVATSDNAVDPALGYRPYAGCLAF